MKRCCYSCQFYKEHNGSDYCISLKNIRSFWENHSQPYVDFLSGEFIPVECRYFNKNLDCQNFMPTKFGKLGYFVNKIGMYPILLIFIAEVLILVLGILIGISISSVGTNS